MKIWLAAATLAAVAACSPPPPALAELCKIHVTDKCPGFHDYVEIYELLFAPRRETTRRVLEIGVWKGASLKLWADYFPQADIFGIDIEPTPQLNVGRVHTMVADQAKREDLQAMLAKFGGDYDIIIDDGAHQMLHQQVSFAVLFPALRSGGLYVIEDVHTSFPHLYPKHGVLPDGSNSTWQMIDTFVRTNEVRSRYMTDAERAYLEKHIRHCMYFFKPTRRHSDFLVCRKK